MHLAALHTPSQIQLNKEGNLKHFLTIEGLSKETLTKILDTAQSFFNDQNQLITNNLLEGKTVMNLFFENSTRTRTTFEAAAKRLSANVLNIDIARSSTSKGETLRDTLWNLEGRPIFSWCVIHLQGQRILLPRMSVQQWQLLMPVMAVMRIRLKRCWTC